MNSSVHTSHPSKHTQISSSSSSAFALKMGLVPALCHSYAPLSLTRPTWPPGTFRTSFRLPDAIPVHWARLLSASQGHHWETEQGLGQLRFTNPDASCRPRVAGTASHSAQVVHFRPSTIMQTHKHIHINHTHIYMQTYTHYRFILTCNMHTRWNKENKTTTQKSNKTRRKEEKSA